MTVLLLFFKIFFVKQIVNERVIVQLDDETSQQYKYYCNLPKLKRNRNHRHL